MYVVKAIPLTFENIAIDNFFRALEMEDAPLIMWFIEKYGKEGKSSNNQRKMARRSRLELSDPCVSGTLLFVMDGQTLPFVSHGARRKDMMGNSWLLLQRTSGVPLRDM